MVSTVRFLLAALSATLLPQEVVAAAVLDGGSMNWPWVLPFIGILLSIATGPLLFPKIWHRHYGKFTAGWAVLALVPMALVYGGAAAVGAFVHAMLAEYLTFIVVLFALYTVAG